MISNNPGYSLLALRFSMIIHIAQMAMIYATVRYSASPSKSTSVV